MNPNNSGRRRVAVVLLLLLQCALSWAFSLGGQAGGFRQQTSLCKSRWQNYRSSTSKTVLMAKKTQPAPLPTTDDPFLLLGLDNATADKQEIKRAYRKRAMQYHPDVLLDQDSTEAEREQASKNFARINAAYEMLTGGTKGNANTGSTSAKTTSGGYNYQPPHRRSSSYSSSSSTRSTNWEDYMPNYNDEDAKYDAGGDSFSSIFSDLLTGAVGAAAGVAGSRGGGIFGDFIDFLEGNIDGFESGYSGYDDDRSLSELLNYGSFDDIANEMDETDILVTSLETKQKSVENDLVQIQADLNVATKFSEKLDLEERIAELKAREKVVKGYLKKGRNRLIRLRERYKELMVEGRGGRGYGSRTSESSASSSSSYSASSSGPSSSYRTTNPSTTSSPPPSPPPPAPSTSASSDKNWRTEGFSSSYGRSSSGRRSSRGNRQRTGSVNEPSESSATNQQQPNQQQQRASETYSNRSSSSTNSSARSSTSSPPKQYEPWVPPHRRTTSSTEAAAEDKKRLRELQVDDEFEKLKREMALTLLLTTTYEQRYQRYTKAVAGAQRYLRAATFSLTIASIIRNYYCKNIELFFRKVVSYSYHLTEEEEKLTWSKQHAQGAKTLSNTITTMQGFYVKAAQIIASRPDSIPKEYADALSVFTDDNDPLPPGVIKGVIEKELLVQRGEQFDDVFEEFDEVPLGSASVAQVHRAVLTKKYGSKEVAVKVQRPSIEDKLMGDIANLKQIAKVFGGANLPVDYYTVFTELEEQLKDEFDFEAEATSMERMHNILTTDENGAQRESPIVTPRSVPALVSKRVLVMDYLKGVPLSRASEEMKRKGVAPDGVEAKLFARKLLDSLTTAFGWSILESGFFHADAHPGNIFVLDDGSIGLIDFGQVKRVNSEYRKALAKVILALDERKSDVDPADLERIGNSAAGLGIELKDNVPAHGHPAVAMWLFDGSVETFPNGYDESEISPNSPVKAMKEFPQDLVLLARSTVLVKGIAKRFGIRWSLSREWAPIARRVLNGSKKQHGEGKSSRTTRLQFKSWGKQKAKIVLTHLPAPMKKQALSAVLRNQQRRDATKREKRVKTNRDRK